MAFAVGYYFFSFTASTLNVSYNDENINYTPNVTYNENSTRGSYIRGQNKYNNAASGADDKTYTDVDPEIDCYSFDHGDTSPTPGVESLFNCNSEKGKCKWH